MESLLQNYFKEIFSNTDQRCNSKNKVPVFFAFLYLLMLHLPLKAADYYWVGGTGNWSDISHWATISGGSIKYTLPPSAADNVFFDGGSGFTSASKTVTVNQNSFCNNITWSGSSVPPTFTISNTIQVNGSLQFQPGMTVNGSAGSASITYSGSLPNQTITTGNILVNIPFTFNGTGGWILQDSLKLLDGYTLDFTRGNLDFNGQYVKMGYFAGAATSGVLKIANSTIYVTGSWSYNTAGSTSITAANSVNSQIFSVGGMATKANDVYYNVTISNANNNNATLSGGGIFNSITFLSGGTIRAATTDSLVLMKAKVYNMVDNNIIINKYFKANLPPCSGLIELIGAGTIKMGTGAVADVANARIQNMTIQGTAAPYAALSSIDAGGNTGWSFTAPTPQTYYWVGGGGNWNDVSHWANSSGGIGGTGCVPILLDDVIFDANSGFGTTTATKTVSLDGNAYCNNMTWNGAPNNPIFSLNNPLQINASLQLQPNMTTASTGGGTYIINFTTALPDQTITSNGAVINVPITFNGAGGWSLQDSLKIPNQQVTFTNGNLNFNNQYAIMKFFSSSGGNTTRALNIANSTIDVGYPGWTYTGGVTLTAANTANSEIRVVATAASVNAKSTDIYNNVTFLASYYVQSGITNGTYNKVSVVGGSGFNMNNITTDSLVLKSIGRYLWASTTNTVRKYFEASPPPCTGLIELVSSSTGSQRTIAMSANSVVNVSNCRIQDTRITGSTPYTAAGSIDLGNNSGWTFIAPTAHTYYWVGGAGNWNDGNHWANASGGTPGSGCVPTQYDNVIFDGGSGFLSTSRTVTVDGAAYCDSMTWAGSPVLPVFNVSQALQVNGSFKLQQNMSLTLAAFITFTSSRPNETITTSNIAIGGSSNGFSFNGTGGWTLTDSLKLSNNTMILNRGNLNFNGQYVRATSLTSTSSFSRTLNIANSTIDLIGSNGGGNWNFIGTGSGPLTAAQSANSTIRFSGNNPVLTADIDDIYNNIEYSSASLANIATITRGTYNKITAVKGALSLNAITTDTLIYAPGGSINTFTSGTTSVINKLWMVNGTPCLSTTIQSTSAGTRTNISMPSTAANVQPDTVLFEFVRIKDLNAVAGTDRAKLKKGPQSIDNSGYGLSGNNSNWTIAPYVGASGFDGLGPDVARGCQDYPYTVQLAAAYYAGTDGSYEWRKDNPSGPIIGTQPQLSTTAPGTYYLKVNYDLAKTCSLSDSKVVFASADTLIWTGLAGNSDWNNSANWKKPDGTSDVTTVPRNCTNVFIPSDMSYYPNLNMENTSRESYSDAACQNIHFASGAEVAYTDSLYYSRAYVDLTLQRNNWHMLSAPLQNMYSGDYWLAPWNVTSANSTAYNRNNPRVYMQQYQIPNPETGYYPGEADWSQPFNTLDVVLGIGQGYLVGIDQPGTDQTFHFPRPETQYQYFSKTSGLPVNTWSSVLDRNKSYRLYLEPGFQGVMPISWDSISRSTIILGNPFMSYLNFSALQAANPGIFGGAYYAWTGNSFDAFIVTGNLSARTDWTSLEAIGQVAPMQSFIVEKQAPESLITSVNINSGMTVLSSVIENRSHEEIAFSAFNMAVYRDDIRQSGATLITAGLKSVPTLFSGTVKNPAIIYFGNKTKPFSILSSGLEKGVEVGIRTTVTGMLTFKVHGIENLPSGTNIFLEDKLLGVWQDMITTPEYAFNNETGNIEGRFFLRSSRSSSGVENIISTTGISIYSTDHEITIKSDKPLRAVVFYDLQGNLIYKQTNIGRNNYTFQLESIKQIVVVKASSDNSVRTEKIILK